MSMWKFVEGEVEVYVGTKKVATVKTEELTVDKICEIARANNVTSGYVTVVMKDGKVMAIEPSQLSQLVNEIVKIYIIPAEKGGQ